jgi:hypothetical protein
MQPDYSSRTLADVQDQVAHELAARAISKSEIIDGIRVGVAISLSKTQHEQFVRQVA